MRRDEPLGHAGMPHRVARRRDGMILLEAMVATLILAIAGVAIASTVGASLRAVTVAHRADAEHRAANEFFERVALWPREDLERRLGTHRQGPWNLTIDRPHPTLFLLELSDTTRGTLLLRTGVHRTDTSRVAY